MFWSEGIISCKGTQRSGYKIQKHEPQEVLQRQRK